MFLTGRFMSFRTSNANTIPSIFTFLSFSQHPGLVARTTDAFRNAQKFCRKEIYLSPNLAILSKNRSALNWSYLFYRTGTDAIPGRSLIEGA
jgi:hypothetical protein